MPPPRYAIFSPFGRTFGTIRPFLSQPANALWNAPPGALAFPGASLRTDKNHKGHSGIPGCNARARARSLHLSQRLREAHKRTLPLFWSRRNFPAEPHVTWSVFRRRDPFAESSRRCCIRDPVLTRLLSHAFSSFGRQPVNGSVVFNFLKRRGDVPLIHNIASRIDLYCDL